MAGSRTKSKQNGTEGRADSAKDVAAACMHAQESRYIRKGVQRVTQSPAASS